MIRLGDITFGMEVDTRPLQKSVKDVVKFGSVVSAASRRTDAASKQVAAGLRAQEKAALSALRATLRTRNALRTAGAPTNLITENTNAYKRLAREMTKTGHTALSLQRAQQAFATDNARINRSLTRFRLNLEANGTASSRFATHLRELSSATVLAVGPLSGVGARLTAISGMFTRSTMLLAAFTVGLTGATVALGSMTSAAIRTAFDIDRINARLRVTVGGTGAATVAYERLWRMADRLGLSFSPLANQFTKLASASQGTSLEGEKTWTMFENIAGAAAAFRIPGQELEGILKAIEQMMSKGKIMSEELRHQLGDRLPGAFRIAADSMGLTTSELDKLLKKGGVAAETFLPNFAAALAKVMKVTGDVRIDSLQASLERFRNSLFKFNEEFDRSQSVSLIFQRSLEALTGVILLAANNIDNIVAGFVGMGVALAALALPKIIALIVTLSGVIRTATAAMLAFNVATMANPLTGFIGLVAKVALVVGSATAAFWLSKKAMTGVSNSYNLLITNVDDYLAAQKRSLSLQTGITDNFITNVQKQILAQKALVQVEIDRLKTIKKSSGIMSQADTIAQNEAIAAGMERMIKLQTTMFNLDLLKRKQLKEQKRRESSLSHVETSDKEIRAAQRRAEAIAEANEKILRSEMMFEASKFGPGAVEESDRFLRRIEAQDKFKDSLVKAKVAQEDINRLTERYNEILLQTESGRKAIETLHELQTSFQDTLSTGFGQASDALVDMFMRTEDAVIDFGKLFRGMAADIIKQLMRILILKPIMDAMFGTASGGTLFATGMPTPLPGITPSAKGNAFGASGLITSPTMFGFGNGQLGSAGENGTEAIMPLVRDSSGRLGVSAVGGGGGNNGGTIIMRPEIRIIDQNNNSISTRQGSEGGVDFMEILLGPMSGNIESGQMDGPLAARTGGRPPAIRRGYG